MEVRLVLVGERGEVNVGLGQVDALAGADVAIVQCAYANIFAFDSNNEEGEDAVVNVDELAGCRDLWQIFLYPKVR